MRVSDIVKAISAPVERHGADVEVSNVTADSHQVRPGMLFAAIPGTRVDGWDYVDDACKRGAVAVLSERTLPHRGCGCHLVVPDVRVAFAEAAALLNGRPARLLKTVGITGTNGKTTVGYMTRDALLEAGFAPGLIGTVAYEVGARVIPAARTTPDAAMIQNLLKQMAGVGCRAAVMEVSSHALAQKRVHGIDFDVAVFTNLTRDHLDYHKTMEAYFETKAMLFRALKPEATAVLNTDTTWGAALYAMQLPCAALTYGTSAAADVVADNIDMTITGSRFMARTPWGQHDVRLNMPGRHNINNALACIAVCGALGVDLQAPVAALSRLKTVRGRLESVVGKQKFSVFVDYAHTDDALGHALKTLRELTTGRVIVVFGCGGDRDKSKRPLMGRVAAALADEVVITSDNPRSEEPRAIMDDILEGLKATDVTPWVIEDRAEAIERAIGLAQPGDAVLIAGKGHETYQELGCRIVPFDDYEISQKALKAKAGKTMRNPRVR